MGLGLGIMAMPPKVFWAMTVREFEAAVRGRLGAGGSASPLDRPGLERLMARYPDEAGSNVKQVM